MRYSFLVILIIFSSCNIKNERNNSSKLSEAEIIEYFEGEIDTLVNMSKMYIPNTLQDSLLYMLPINVVDSLKEHSKNLFIKAYKSSDIRINNAIEYLKLYLLENHKEIDKLLVSEVRKANDSIIELHVIHLDDLVLEYYYDIGKVKKYKKIIGNTVVEEGEIIVTGNPTGQDCIYTVNLLNRRINVNILQ